MTTCVGSERSKVSRLNQTLRRLTQRGNNNLPCVGRSRRDGGAASRMRLLARRRRNDDSIVTESPIAPLRLLYTHQRSEAYTMDSIVISDEDSVLHEQSDEEVTDSDNEPQIANNVTVDVHTAQPPSPGSDVVQDGVHSAPHTRCSAEIAEHPRARFKSNGVAQQRAGGSLHLSHEPVEQKCVLRVDRRTDQLYRRVPDIVIDEVAQGTDSQDIYSENNPNSSASSQLHLKDQTPANNHKRQVPTALYHTDEDNIMWL